MECVLPSSGGLFRFFRGLGGSNKYPNKYRSNLCSLVGQVSRSPYQGVKFYGASDPQFQATVAKASSASTYGVGDVLSFEVSAGQTLRMRTVFDKTDQDTQ